MRKEKNDAEIVDEAMNYAYMILTGKATFEELIGSEDEVMLPYNILENEDIDYNVLIKYFEDTEEFEKCAELLILVGMNEVKNKKNN